MDIAKTVSFGLAATLLLGVARFDIAVAQDAAVAPAAAAAAAPADKAVAVKAKADAVIAQARAKAEAETDPVKRKQYRKDAEQVAANAEKVKANADRVSAEARRRNGEAMQQAGAAMRAGADARRVNAEAMQQAGAAMRKASADRLAAEAATIRAESVTIDGHTFAGNVELKQGKPGGPVTIAADRVIADLPQDNDISQNKVMSRFSSTKNGVHIDAQVASADSVVLNRPEVAAAVTDAMRAAIAEASRKIDAAVAEAKAKAGLPPTAPVSPVSPIAPD